MSATIEDLLALVWFAEVVEQGGFSAAARTLGVPRQTVFRRISKLESTLGLRLLERSTRKSRPTDAGRRLYTHAAQMVVEARAAAAAMEQARAQPTGRLRITAPQLFGEAALGTAINTYLGRWPEARLDVSFSLEPVDLLAGDFDLALRIGALSDSALLSRHLGVTTLTCCASPAYLAGAPALGRPRDLSQHRTIHYGRVPADGVIHWRFLPPPASAPSAEQSQDAAGPIDILLRPRLAVESAALACQAALEHLGIVRLPRFACQRHLADGTLVELLLPWPIPDPPVYAVYASRAAGNPALQEFLDILKQSLAQTEWLRAPGAEV